MLLVSVNINKIIDLYTQNIWQWQMTIQGLNPDDKETSKVAGFCECIKVT